MLKRLAVLALLIAAPALAETAPAPRTATLDTAQRAGYRAVFAAIRDGRWLDAQIALDTLAPGPLHAIARAELYTAHGSPRVELEPLVALLTQAPELPEGEALARLARSRGAVDLPPLPQPQALIWQDGAPRRVRAHAIRSDQIAADLAVQMQPLVKGDRGPEAQALLDVTPGLSPEAQTEWRQRIAWMYFVANDDANARAMGDKAAEGSGDWAIQGRWVAALSTWRSGDFAGAQARFEGTAARASDVDLRAAALYWTARADLAAGRPEKVAPHLANAAQFGDSFYGQLARQALALRDPAHTVAIDREGAALGQRPNIRVAAALAEVGETDLANDVIRHQARIGDPREFGTLIRVAEALDLPATAVWLVHNCPAGVKPAAEARFPVPSWAPDSGWRVERALVLAHALEESGFRNRVVSPTGAYGLMQIMPAAASDYAREQGTVADRGALTRPSTNIDVGQRQLERLRDMSLTGGLLPKVIAAYNAGPKPVSDWNYTVRDGGDPLLYIESIPYWETRGYVTTVLRNYWMYQAKGGKVALPSRAALAQGMWPRFPGLPGASAVRLNARPNAAASAAVGSARAALAE